MTTQIHSNKESRSERHNLPVCHPSIWRVIVDQILAPATRLHHYRDLSRRIVEDTMYERYCGGRK